jgi:hypothetical protein
MRAFISAGLLLAASLPASALILDEYPEYRGTWSLNCKNPSADKVQVEVKKVTITHAGTPHEYRGVELSHTFGGGAKADGKNAWIMISKIPDGEYVFIAEVPGHKRKGPLELQEQGPDAGTEVKPLWGKKFQKCPTT